MQTGQSAHDQSGRRRIVVTGIGMVNPMGHNADEVWKGLQAGESGVDYTTLFDASGFPTKISAEVKGWDLREDNQDLGRVTSLGRHTKFAIGAAKQAMTDSGVFGLDHRSRSLRRLPGQRRRESRFPRLQ